MVKRKKKNNDNYLNGNVLTGFSILGGVQLISNVNKTIVCNTCVSCEMIKTVFWSYVSFV